MSLLNPTSTLEGFEMGTESVEKSQVNSLIAPWKLLLLIVR